MAGTENYKDFEVITADTPKPWGFLDYQLQKTIIDTLLGNCANPVKDTINGHKHFYFYDTDGNTVISGTSNNANISNANIVGDLTVSGGITFAAFSTTGVLHNNSSGVISTSLIVNDDIDSGAAIEWSKINSALAITNSDISEEIADRIVWTKINKFGAAPSDIGASPAYTTSSVLKGDGAGGFTDCVNLTDDLFLTEIDGAALDVYFPTGTGFIKRTGSETYIIDASSVTSHDILSSTHLDALTHTVVRGDLIVGNSTPQWSALTIGTNGYILRSNGTDAAWSSLTTAGIQPANANLSAIAITPFANNEVILLTGTATCTHGRIVNSYISDTAGIAISKLATISASRILGNNTGGSSYPLELTTAQLKTMCGYYTSGDCPTFGSAVVGGPACTFYNPSASNHTTVVINSTANMNNIISFQTTGTTKWNMSTTNTAVPEDKFVIRCIPRSIDAFNAYCTTTKAQFSIGVDGVAQLISNRGLHIGGDTLRLDTKRVINPTTTSGYVGEICWDRPGGSGKVHIYICLGGTLWGDFTSANL
jgi:hypothetical protein